MIFIGTIFGDIEFDVTINENLNSSNTITVNPVEAGADIADHNYVLPRRISFQGGVTDTPLNNLQTFGTGTVRSQTAYDILEQIKNAGELFTAITELGEIPNVVIVDLVVPKDSKSANALLFTCTIQEMFITEVKEGVLSPDQLADVVNRQAASNVERGNITKVEVKDKSVLSTVIDINNTNQ